MRRIQQQSCLAFVLAALLPRNALGFLGVVRPTNTCRSGLSAAKIPSAAAAALQAGLFLFEDTSPLQAADVTRDEKELFQDLCALVCPESDGLLRLDEDDDGNQIRGVYVNRPVHKGETILSIPLSRCIRDDEPPGWILDHLLDQPPLCVDDVAENYAAAAWNANDDHNEEDTMGWAIRLAASLIGASSSNKHLDEEKRLWFSLFPNPSYLRASLPVHWPEDVVAKAKCTALELAVDTSYFSRAQAVEDILGSLEGCGNAAPWLEDETDEARRRLIHNALDLVQTRACRVVDNGQPIRLLAPVFDFINHNAHANAEFVLEEEEAEDDGGDGELFLVVQAVQDICAHDEVWIDYGESSTRPDWRCLNSYGFVPAFQPGVATPVRDGEHTAEVFLQGQRFLISPDSVSEDMVHVMAVALGEADPDDYESGATLTPKIALRLAQRIAEAAFQNLLVDDDDDDDDEEGLLGEDGGDVYMDTPEAVISEQLAASLRWNQHRIQMACSLGLRDWAMKQSFR